MFTDRREAGRRLAERLHAWRGAGTLVAALPRGGVPVAAEVAAVLDAPLDVLLVRKLGAPRQPELAVGAIGEGGIRVLDAHTVRRAGVTAEQLGAIERRERAELERRAAVYRAACPAEPIEGRAVIVVDDGVATGATAEAACQVARSRGAASVALATPVAPNGWTERLGAAADEYVAVSEPTDFSAVGEFYADFREVDDDEVVRILEAQDRGR